MTLFVYCHLSSTLFINIGPKFQTLISSWLFIILEVAEKFLYGLYYGYQAWQKLSKNSTFLIKYSAKI
jgi:hypothetical protein